MRARARLDGLLAFGDADTAKQHGGDVEIAPDLEMEDRDVELERLGSASGVALRDGATQLTAAHPHRAKIGVTVARRGHRLIEPVLPAGRAATAKRP